MAGHTPNSLLPVDLANLLDAMASDDGEDWDLSPRDRVAITAALACIEAQQLLLKRAMSIITDAIMHGMPITEEVADVRNLIVGADRKFTLTPDKKRKARDVNHYGRDHARDAYNRGGCRPSTCRMTGRRLQRSGFAVKRNACRRLIEPC